MTSIKQLLLGMLLLVAGSFVWAAPVNINSADADALAENIIGVGKARAEAIVTYRNEHGPFKSVDELTQIKGIGMKIVEANRANLKIRD